MKCGLQKMNVAGVSMSKLGLYRCNKCRRAFFSAERRKQHVLSIHGIKLRNMMIQSHAAQHKITTSKPEILPILTIKKHRYKSKSEAMLATLLKFWPPENAFNRFRTIHHLSQKRIESIFKRMLVNNFSPIMHGTQNIEKSLIEEYSKNSAVTRQRSESLSMLTGLNARYIRLWFYWRRKKGHRSCGEQLLNKTFADQPYVSDEALQMLVNSTGMLISQIRLWFRLMRAKNKMMDFKEVEEKVLWACFLKNPECPPGSQEVINVSEVVGMGVEDVNTIFRCWKSVWGLTDLNEKEKIIVESETTCNSLETSSSVPHDSVLDSLEKARTSQKELGIPTHCKIIEFHSYLRTIDKQFDSYEPTGRRLNCENDQDSLHNVFGISDVSEDQYLLDDICQEDIDFQLNLIDDDAYSHSTHSLLKIKSNVLDPVSNSSIGNKEEQGLYSLFNVAPSQHEQDHLDSESVHDMLSSSENDSSDGDSGNESESSRSSGAESIEFVSEVARHPAISEVIDLTLDSDEDDGSEPQTSNEYVSINLGCEIAKETDHQQTQHTVGHFEATEPAYDAIADSNICSDTETFFEPTEPLVICESDDEAGTQSDEDTDSVEHTCPSEKSACQSWNIILAKTHLSEETQKSQNVNMNSSEEFPAPSTSKVQICNSFKTLHVKKGAIFTEAHFLSKPKLKAVKTSKKAHRPANCKRRPPIAKSLFNKSLLESRRSAYIEMKKRLLHRHKSAVSTQELLSRQLHEPDE